MVQRSENVLNCKGQESLSAKPDFHFFYFIYLYLPSALITYSLEHKRSHLDEVCLSVKSRHGEAQGRNERGK